MNDIHDTTPSGFIEFFNACPIIVSSLRDFVFTTSKNLIFFKNTQNRITELYVIAMVLALKSVWAKPEAICWLLADRIQVASRLPAKPALRFARTANGELDIGYWILEVGVDLFIRGFWDLCLVTANVNESECRSSSLSAIGR